MISEVWSNPEGRPSTLWGITDPFEAIYFDFEVLANIRKAERDASQPPKSAKESYQRSLQKYPAEMQEKVTKRIERQRAKATKRQTSEIEMNNNVS